MNETGPVINKTIESVIDEIKGKIVSDQRKLREALVNVSRLSKKDSYESENKARMALDNFRAHNKEVETLTNTILENKKILEALK